MEIDLYAGIPVRDFEKSKSWYEKLLGGEPSFMPYDTEAVWEIAEHRYLFIVQKAEGTGHAEHTIFVGDLDAVVSGISSRGIEPSERETYSNGVRKVIYRDDEGNEIGYGGAPLE